MAKEFIDIVTIHDVKTVPVISTHFYSGLHLAYINDKGFCNWTEVTSGRRISTIGSKKDAAALLVQAMKEIDANASHLEESLKTPVAYAKSLGARGRVLTEKEVTP